MIVFVWIGCSRPPAGALYSGWLVSPVVLRACCYKLLKQSDLVPPFPGFCNSLMENGLARKRCFRAWLDHLRPSSLTGKLGVSGEHKICCHDCRRLLHGKPTMNPDITRTSGALLLSRAGITKRLVITPLHTSPLLLRQQSGHLPDITFSSSA